MSEAVGVRGVESGVVQKYALGVYGEYTHLLRLSLLVIEVLAGGLQLLVEARHDGGVVHLLCRQLLCRCIDALDKRTHDLLWGLCRADVPVVDNRSTHIKGQV
jgi:hypothetical protein